MDNKEFKKEIKEVVKKYDYKTGLSKKKTTYYVVEIELTNTFKGQIFMSNDLVQAMEIVNKAEPIKAIKSCEIIENVSKKGNEFYSCVVTLTNGFDDSMFLPMTLTKMINILRK